MAVEARARLELVLGVMVAPANVAARDGARATWMRAADERAVVRFVVGNRRCARQLMDAEASRHGDIVYVDSPDCHKGRSAEKVHAWFLHAASFYASARWVGKTEDDAFVRLPVLLADLSPLRVLAVDVYGLLFYSGACRDDGQCRFRFCGSVHSLYRIQYMHRLIEPQCAEDTSDEARRHPCVRGITKRGSLGNRGCNTSIPAIVPGSSECPRFDIVPFVDGPLEVRSMAFTRKLARCTDAERFFLALSARSNGSMCGATDMTQGHALRGCYAAVSRRSQKGVRAADILGDRRAWMHQLPNGSAGRSLSRKKRWVVQVPREAILWHPLKRASVEQWLAAWRKMEATARAAPPTPVRLPVVQITWGPRESTTAAAIERPTVKTLARLSRFPDSATRGIKLELVKLGRYKPSENSSIWLPVDDIENGGEICLPPAGVRHQKWRADVLKDWRGRPEGSRQCESSL